MNTITEIKIDLKNNIGQYCLDSSKAINLFRHDIMDNTIGLSDEYIVSINIDGVKVMNSSFAKALFGNLAYKLKENFDTHVNIIGGHKSLRDHIYSFIQLGKQSQ